MSAQKLYTPQMLSAAMELANWPLLGNGALHGDARSTTCGSTLGLDLELDERGVVVKIGLQVRACAVGQASSAIFVRHIVGRNIADLLPIFEQMKRWVKEEGRAPNWPDLELIEAARDYPARHGAMLLVWNAAKTALSSAERAG